MGKKRVSSLDVARLAGVSQSAVSRAFSGADKAPRVSDAMRDRVLRAADKLGYRPNALARAVFVGRSQIVAVLFSYLNNQFYAEALEQICHALQRNGLHALVFMVPDTTEDIDRIVGEILQYQVDGLITASVELSSGICQQCYDQQIPVVMFNRTQDDQRLSAVTADNVAGARAVAQHFVRTGHRRISMIAGWEGASTNRDREIGFKSGLSLEGMTLHSRTVGHFDRRRAGDATREMFSVPAGQRPDAVFVANDYMAIAVMDTLRFELGIKVPDDVSVIGYDDIEMASLPTYDLTTMRQPLARMVEATMRVLVDKIEARTAEPEHISIGGQLVVRGTVRERAG